MSVIILDCLIDGKVVFNVYGEIQMNGQCRSSVYLEKKTSLHQPIGWELSDWPATKTQMSQIRETKVFRESVQK